MPALMAVIGANADPFRKELLSAQAMAARAGQNIERNLKAGISGGMTGHSGRGGIIGEMFVIMREIGRGNFARVPGSITILAQRMGLLKLVMKDSASAAQVVAQAYGQLSLAAAQASVAAATKAAASQAAFAADLENTEATLAQALADEEGAAAARLNAVAMMNKAEAAQTAAAAQGAAAAASVGPLGIALGIVIALGAGFYAASKIAANLTDKLAGIKLPDFHPEYIAKHLQATNQVAEGWKEIGREVDHAVDKYNSAAEAAKRLADVTKEQFDHEKKMAGFAKERDMAGAKTPAQKFAVEKKYAAEELDRANRERQADLAQKAQENFNLLREGEAKKREADSIKTPSKEHDKNIAADLKAKSKASQDFLDAHQKELIEGKGIGGHAQTAYLAAFGALNGVSNEDIEKAKKDAVKAAAGHIKAANDFEDTEHENDLKRKRKEELTKEAGAAFSKAVVGKGELDVAAKAAAKKSADESAESAAQLAAEKAKLDAEHGPKLLHGNLNALQRIGGYASPAGVSMIDVAKKSERHLAAIKSGVDKLNSGHRSKLGAVQHQ